MSIEYYGIMKKELSKEILSGRFGYEWSGRFGKEKHLFDLFIVLYENHLYRIATYSTKTKKVELICPQWYCPSCKIINEFMDLCEKKVANENQNA